MTSVSIIIVHYNSEEVTRDCLQSLEKIDQTNIDLKVILVDNGSKIPFSFQTDKYAFDLIRSEENTGFTGGNNIGIKHALNMFKSEYVLLLNSDTTIEPHFLSKLVHFAQNHKKVGTVSPKIYFEKGYEFHKDYKEEEKGKVIWFAGGSLDWKNMYGFHRGVDEVDRGQFDLELMQRNKNEIPYYGYQTMDFASGCCVLIPAQVLKEVGMFDQSYFLYWEDTDLSVRIQKAGYKLYFCPEAIIWHKNAGSSGGAGSTLHQKFQNKNRLKFAMKYAPLRTKLAVLKDYLKS